MKRFFPVVLLAVLSLILPPSLAQAALPEAQVSAPEPELEPEDESAGVKDFFLGLAKQGKVLADQGRYYDASVAFNGILEKGDAAEDYYKEAEYQIAVSLYDLGLVYSAFSYFTRIADAGEEHPRYKDTLPWLLKIHHDLPGLQAATEYMSAYGREVYPSKLRDELLFVTGRFSYSIDDYDTAKDAFEAIGKKAGEFYVKARFLLGVIQVRQKKPEKALETFKEVLRHFRDEGDDFPGSKALYSETLLNMARVFYSTKQYDLAIKYYGRIEKYSDHWLQSLFEMSWTHFRQRDYAKAMGSLHTLNSPYFEEQYFPESQVLQAVILYSNCRYEDAILVVDQFVKNYDTLRKELASNLKENEDATDFYYWLATLGTKGKLFSMRLKRIFNVALNDGKLYRLFSLIISLNREEALLESMQKAAVQKELAARLLGDLVTYRELAIGETGEQARTKLSTVHKDLRKLVSQAMKVKFESLNALKEIIEGKRAKTKESSEAGKVNTGNAELFVEWPFEGEYWKDELDSYLFRVESLCPERKK